MTEIKKTYYAGSDPFEVTFKMICHALEVEPNDLYRQSNQNMAG